MTLTLNLLWFYGLTLCGPLRTVLVTQHSSSALLLGLLGVNCCIKSKENNKGRGFVLYFVAILSLLLVDHDDNSPHHQAYHAGHASQHRELYTLFTHMFGWTDISDHKGGVLLLAFLLLINSAAANYGRKVAAAVGGIKRLHALGTLLGAAMLFPWAMFYHSEHLVSAVTTSTPVIILTAVAMVADFYTEAAAAAAPSNKNHLSRVGSLSSFATALILSSITMSSDHMMSPGVVFASVLFGLAAMSLTSNNSHNSGGARGVFVGYSASTGQPLYTLSSSSNDSGHSFLNTAKKGFKQIVEDSNSRIIFYFLLLNLFFTFVEFAYGIWSNSLGLISDGFHMLFDCSALVMGLYASVLSRWKPTKSFSYGYDRLEVLSGFVNGLFLAVIAINVFMEALERLVDPPNVGTDRLLVVSVSGLMVNIVGIFAFSHGGGGGGGHGHSHGGGGGHGHSHNVNMEGVFLHIMADTLGSVGVIISSVLIEYYGLFIADPICSLFIAVTIFVSVLPLLKQSAKILLLATPTEISAKVDECLKQLPSKVEGVRSVVRASLWSHTGERVHANIAIKVDDAADGQTVTDVVIRLLREAGVHSPVVQVEKEPFSMHLRGLGTKFLQQHQLVSNNMLGL